MKTRVCKICKKEKDISFFRKQRACKKCVTASRSDYIKEYSESNKEKLEKYRKEYYRKNKSKLLEQNRRYKIKRKRTDKNYKLAMKLRTRMYQALKGNFKSGSAVNDLGCTIEEFKLYLESKFEEGMSWDNWEYNGWHIDHIIPLASFDLTDRSQFLKACHYTNMRPMWGIDNIIKGSSQK